MPRKYPGPYKASGDDKCKQAHEHETTGGEWGYYVRSRAYSGYGHLSHFPPSPPSPFPSPFPSLFSTCRRSLELELAWGDARLLGLGLLESLAGVAHLDVGAEGGPLCDVVGGVTDIWVIALWSHRRLSPAVATGGGPCLVFSDAGFGSLESTYRLKVALFPLIVAQCSSIPRIRSSIALSVDSVMRGGLEYALSSSSFGIRDMSSRMSYSRSTTL
ncbi:unnamed protein product, partial [Rhizoctonia solani]